MGNLEQAAALSKMKNLADLLLKIARSTDKPSQVEDLLAQLKWIVDIDFYQHLCFNPHLQLCYQLHSISYRPPQGQFHCDFDNSPTFTEQLEFLYRKKALFGEALTQLPLLQKQLQWQQFGVDNVFCIHLGQASAQCSGMIFSTRRNGGFSRDDKTLLMIFANSLLLNINAHETLYLAEQASRAKSDFVAHMSHEIRTPLNGMLETVELLQNTSLDETQQFYIQTIQSSSRTLLSVINDILDYSRVDAGKLELDIQPFNLADLIEELVFPFRTQSLSELVVVASIDPDVPVFLRGDSVRLQQVLINLLGNAIKFTTEGAVILQVASDNTFDNTTSSQVSLTFSVTDTGIGISEEARGSLFTAFQQADASISREFGGTGLGLTISQCLVNLMGGELQVKSALGKGSCFYFSINLPHQPEAVASQKVSVTLAGKRVTIIDDQQAYLDIIGRQAESLGVQALCLKAGAQLQQQLANAIPPDLFLIDQKMPGLDGFELSRQLSQDPRWATIPRVLITAFCGLPSSDSLRDAGFQRGYIKPTSKEVLQRLLLQVFNTAEQAAVAARQLEVNTINDYSQLRVLIVDDNSVNRMVAQNLLKKLEIENDCAEDGLQAVDIVCRQHKSYDLILMDCEMPKLDGYATTQQIRLWEQQTQQTPVSIYALSAYVMPEQVRACLHCGMDDHLPKPINLQLLRTKLDQLFS
ncbi:MAG: response regulator [Pseudomonadales bacterium]